MASDGSDFLLHLYDKLWENMNTKEARLWNFLSIYGGVIALAFAAGQFVGAELYATLMILLLTTWAVLIIANANWWYQRNRLIVSQIEGKFPNAVKGIIPSSYREANFQVDRLYKASALILTSVAVLLYLRTMLGFLNVGSISDSRTAVVLCLLYFLSVLCIGLCISQYETYFNTYYRVAALDIDVDSGKDRDQIKKKLLGQELQKRVELSWRGRAFCVAVLSSIAFDVAFWRNAPGQTMIEKFGITFQGLAVVLFAIHTKAFRKQNSSWSDAEKYYLSLLQKPRIKDKWQPVALIQGTVLSVIVSIGLLAWALNRSSRVFADLTGANPVISTQRTDLRLAELATQVDKTSRQLLDLQRDNVALQEVLLKGKVAGYLKTTDADSKYLTKKDAELIFLSKAEYEGMREAKPTPH